MSHSLMLPPSGADVWVHCAGSSLMTTMCLPQEDTQDTLEGDAVHWLIAEVLKSYQTAHEGYEILVTKGLLGHEAPNGVIITDIMIEAADVMINDVLQLCQKFGLLAKLHIEEPIQIPNIHPQNNGTPDLWVYDEKNHRLHHWDFKYGHKSVPADSWQNKDYVAGELNTLGINGLTDQTTVISMKIIQPRSYHDGGPIKEWIGIASDLRGDFNQLAAKAEEVVSIDPVIQSGSHCRYCLARHQCPANREASTNAIEYSQSAIPEFLTDDGLSFEKTLIDASIERLKHRKTAIDTDILNRILKLKRHIPGYGTEQGTGKRSWKAPNDQIFMLGDLLGVDAKAEEQPVTVAEFERRLLALNRTRKTNGEEPIDQTVINGYITRGNTGIKLVPDDLSEAKRIFSK